MTQAPAQAPFRLRALLPVEHGSWVFLLLPMAAGLVKAPSWAGAGLAMASLAVFLGRMPLQRWRRLRRSLLLFGTVAVLGTLAVVGVAWAALRAGVAPLLVLGLGGLALGPALLGGARRALVPELLGTAGSCALLPALLLAGGCPAGAAGAAFLVLLALVVPPFLFVRRQVAWARGEAFRGADQALLQGAHALALAITLLAWRLGWAGLILPVWAAGLWGRTMVIRRALPARQVGWLEAGITVLHAVVLGFGLRGV